MKKEVVFMHDDADGWMSALLYDMLHNEVEKIFIPINYGNKENEAFNSITISSPEIEKVVFLDYIPSKSKLDFLSTFNFNIEIYDHHKDNIKTLALHNHDILIKGYSIFEKITLFWDLSQSTCGYFLEIYKDVGMPMKEIIRLVSDRDIGMLWEEHVDSSHKERMLEANEIVYLAIESVKYPHEQEKKKMFNSHDLDVLFNNIIDFYNVGLGKLLMRRHENEVQEIVKKSIINKVKFKDKELCFIQVATIKHLSDVGNLIAKEHNCVCCCYYLAKEELIISFRDTKGIALKTAKELEDVFKEYVTSCGGHPKACGMSLKDISIKTIIEKIEKGDINESS